VLVDEGVVVAKTRRENVVERDDRHSYDDHEDWRLRIEYSEASRVGGVYTMTSWEGAVDGT
jgi:hypothetical protein